ncbi:pyridoxal phosphate-dependent aminotransferase [Fulvivirga sedimenti]|uniref:pyridoxal phosphate-dependent aminotransferase n=1 Tax=Fulvivirga sedimenti TaxID=2879465 RepID=UPI002106B6BD|nr:aminotransferase class I/II-fold pyridoxal phosphate-dependent enzyme [Fulvivirga sedimenti]
MIIQEATRIQKVSEYYFSGKLKEISALRQQGRDIINLGIGSPDLSPDPIAIETLAGAAKMPSSHGYQSYIGVPELRDAIAGYMKKHYGQHFDPNTEILPLIGSKEGIMHITMAFVNPGDKVLVPNPGYPTYTSVTRLAEAEPVQYLLDESNAWNIDIAYLEKLPLDEIKLMWVNYPNMPTGAKGSRKDFEKLIALARKHHFLIVNDNPYGQLHEGTQFSIFQIEGAREVCLELNSLSKSHNMAGWRIGWLSGEFDYIRMVLRVKSNMDSGMFLPVQKAAAKMLQMNADWYEKLRGVYASRRKVAQLIMQTLGCSFQADQQGMFVWGKVPDSVKDVTVWTDEILEKAMVFITPGFIFGTAGNRYIRISLCSSEDILEEALRRIQNMETK